MARRIGGNRYVLMVPARAAALANGERFYLDDVPCDRCGTRERYVQNYGCRQCHRDLMKTYDKKRQRKAYRDAHDPPNSLLLKHGRAWRRFWSLLKKPETDADVLHMALTVYEYYNDLWLKYYGKDIWFNPPLWALLKQMPDEEQAVIHFKRKVGGPTLGDYRRNILEGTIYQNEDIRFFDAALPTGIEGP